MRKHYPVLLYLSFFFLMLLGTASVMAQVVKVACIGNSVTYGYGLKDSAEESYPAVLQGLLGKPYEVKNFGLSGATLLKKGHRPYDKSKEFAAAVAYRPDIAIVHLGLNDSDPRNWPAFKDEFEQDYSWLLDTLKKQNPKVKLYICRLTPIFNGHPRFKSGTREWYWQIQDRILQIAAANGAELVDLTTPLYKRPDLFSDNLHPDKEGAAILAKTIYSQLSGNYGGLKLPVMFTDHMVMQRQQPIPVYGTANANERIEVVFHQKKITATADQYGKWKVVFPAMNHGGPHQLCVKTKGSSLVLKDILIGDVWLCSGQSNMAFPLKASATGKAALPMMKPNTTLRLLKFNQIVQTDNVPWDTATLERINQLEFFYGQWENTNARSAADFSAVAYYFGKKLVEEENIPIGLIEVAVGGSTIESWIDRYTMEHDPELVDVLTNWRKSDFVQEWARGRADVNLKNATNPKQRHPYEPVYNYEAGISKLIEFPIKGVIWYQGESNTQNVELYEHSLPVLVNSWRKKWGINFPFYYVQLSSINRPSWPYFRDAQRRLQKVIPNSGMAVSSDLGDSLNVHPTKKKEVGDRLALLALKHTYHKPVIANGPVALNVKRLKNEVVITFGKAKKLLTANQQALTGFELVTEKGLHLVVKATIHNNEVHLKVPVEEKIKSVVYAWQPFTRANLVNEVGLPASTFSISLN